MMISIPQRDTSPHQDITSTAPSGTPPPTQPPPTTTDMGNTAPQRADPTQTADAHSRKRDRLYYCITVDNHKNRSQ